MNRRISLRDILSLAGSYLWTIALIIAGSLVGAVLTSALISALYGLMAKDGMHLMRDALMGEGPAALGLPAQGTGYSISWTSIVYTAGRYLAPVGIWAAFLLYLAHSKTSRPILGILGPHYGSNTLRHFVLGLGLGCALNGICVLAAALSGSIHLSFIGTDAWASSLSSSASSSRHRQKSLPSAAISTSARSGPAEAPLFLSS